VFILSTLNSSILGAYVAKQSYRSCRHQYGSHPGQGQTQQVGIGMEDQGTFRHPPSELAVLPGIRRQLSGATILAQLSSSARQGWP